MTTLTKAHNQWATRPADERFRSLDELHRAVKNRRSNCIDGTINLCDMVMRVNGTLRFENRNGPGGADLTHWSAGQMLSKLGVPRDLLTKLSSHVGTDVLNDRLARALAEGDLQNRQRVLLHSDEDGQRTVRALHGQKYNRLWDANVTATLVENLPSGWYNPVAYSNGKFGAELEPSGLYAGDRSMFAFFVDSGDWSKQENVGSFDVDGEEFNHGFFVWNSEVGSETFGFMPFMFDRVCGNHYVWGARQVQEFKARHVGRGASRLLSTFRNWLNEMDQPKHVLVQRDTFVQAVRRAKDTQSVPVTGGSPEAKLETLTLAFKEFKSHFTQAQVVNALDAMLREESGVTGSNYDWLAGFTAVAREMQNADERSALEMKASALLLK